MKSETNLDLIRIVLAPDFLVQGNHRHQLSDVLRQHSAKDSDIITSSLLSLSSWHLYSTYLSTLSSSFLSMRWNFVKSWLASCSCILAMSGKSPGLIWCSLCSWEYLHIHQSWRFTHNINAATRVSKQINTYRPSRFFINSFFFPSLPNTEGMSFFRLEMM